MTINLLHTNHGGDCCGAKHLYSFPLGHTETQRRAMLKRGIDNALGYFGLSLSKTWRCLVEVILNEYQLHEWCHILEEAGFKQVYSFLNSNSGNECHVFLLETNRPATSGKKRAI